MRIAWLSGWGTNEFSWSFPSAMPRPTASSGASVIAGDLLADNTRLLTRKPPASLPTRRVITRLIGQRSLQLLDREIPKLALQTIAASE
ncbi:hypothetical protein FHT86_000902 [Rhizobium sp. BK313]|nr:hypothetical protein [Rhizobium sp. BK313]